MKTLRRTLLPLAIVGLLFCFLVPSISYSDDAPAKAPAVEKATPAADTPKTDANAVERLSRKQKKELGILPVQVLFKARQMAKDGDLTKEMTSKEMAFSYAAEVADSTEYGAAWGKVRNGTYGVDWDGIIAFLEKLFDLLTKFLPLFL